MTESVNFNLQKVCSMSCNITVSVSDECPYRCGKRSCGFLLLYDKENASTVKVNVVKQLVRDMGFEI